MIHVWVTDSQGFYIECVHKHENELTEYDIKVPLHTEFLCVKPKWNGVEWIEGATQEEIDTWKESNKPKPPEPSQMEVLENENKLLKAQVKALNMTTDFHEELIVEMANKVYA